MTNDNDSVEAVARGLNVIEWFFFLPQPHTGNFLWISLAGEKYRKLILKNPTTFVPKTIAATVGSKGELNAGCTGT